MSWLSSYAKSSVGAKHIMAVSGLALSLFVLIHMLGNFTVFAGQDAMNSYAQAIKSTPPLLWGARLGLLFLVIIHISSALRLVALNRAARPVKYHVFTPKRTTVFARIMPLSGMVLLAFILFHLAHFTVGLTHPEAFSLQETLADGTTRHDVYSMVVTSFQSPIVSLSYIVAMVLLCMHLAHGISSMFQSLGLNHPKYNGIFAKAGPVLATIIFLGNCAIPLSILAGIITLPGA